MADQFRSEELLDSLLSCEAGMNSGVLPILLPRNQLAFARNATVRGAFFTDRPKFRRITLQYGGNSELQAEVEDGLFQRATFYKPDTGSSRLIAAISGRLFQFVIGGTTAAVSEISIPGDLNPPTIPINWLWQSENYVIVNDGISLPIFFDGTTSRRSLGPSVLLGTTAANFNAPAIGANVSITLAAPYTGPIGLNISVCGAIYTVASQAVVNGYKAILTNIDDTPGNSIPADSEITTSAASNAPVGNLFQTGGVDVPRAGSTGWQFGANIILNPFDQARYDSSQIVSLSSIYGQAQGDHHLLWFKRAFNGQYRKFLLRQQADSGGMKSFRIRDYYNNDTGGAQAKIHIDDGEPGYVSNPDAAATNTSWGFTVGATVVPAVNSQVDVYTTLLYSGPVNQPVQINGKNFLLSPTTQPAPTGNTLVVTNVNDPAGTLHTAPCTLNSIAELPPGRMGVYGMGRNWESLPDGRRFLGGDIVGGSSGSAAYNFRDAVLKVRENSYLAGGGYFVIPLAGDIIQFMRFMATLDASLGQGALQVGTQSTVFSCNAPVDRTTWQNLTNPILTESLISNGGQSQDSAIVANGDLIFRSIDGLRSLILARRDFDTWGNVPISREVARVLDADDETLLMFGSSIVFSNRYLTTANPMSFTQGVAHSSLIALNFDPLSSLRGKAPSVYDGEWTGMNVLQLLTGECDNQQRAFAFCLGANGAKIQLWEILNDGVANVDDVDTRVESFMESSSIDFAEKDPRQRHYKRLLDGEIYVDDLIGSVDFSAYYKPDQHPDWVLWHSWTETAGTTGEFRPRMGLGEPDPTECEAITGRPMREGYAYQFKLVITGHCRFLGARFRCVTIPQPKLAPVAGCPPAVTPTRTHPNAPPVPAFNPFAAQFIARAGITVTAQQNAINQLVLDLIAANLWSKLFAFYPIIGGTAESHRYNLLSSNYRIDWAGTLTHDAMGVKSDGATGYGHCVGLKPSNVGSFGGMSAYLREPVPYFTGTPNVLFMGVNEDPSSKRFNMGIFDAIVDLLQVVYGGTERAQLPYLPVQTDAAFYTGNRLSVSDLKLFKNGAQIATNGNTITLASATSTYDFFVMASDSEGTADQFCDKYFGAFAVHAGLSAAETLAFYNAVQTYQIALGRQV